MSTGAVDAGGLVGGAGVVGAVVSGGTLVGGGGVVVDVVVVLVVVVPISGGSPSASIGVASSLVGRLHAPRAVDTARARNRRRLIGRRIMRPPLATGRRSGRRLPAGPRPTPRRRGRWRARRRARGPTLCRSGGGRRCPARSAR